jgi:hypothetical protein
MKAAHAKEKSGAYFPDKPTHFNLLNEYTYLFYYHNSFCIFV